MKELLEQCGSSITTPITTSRTNSELESDRSNISDERLNELMEKYRSQLTSPDPSNMISQEETYNNNKDRHDERALSRSTTTSSHDGAMLSSRTVTPAKSESFTVHSSIDDNIKNYDVRSEIKSPLRRPLTSEATTRTQSAQPDKRSQIRLRNSTSNFNPSRNINSAGMIYGNEANKEILRPNSASANLPSLSYQQIKSVWGKSYSRLSKSSDTEEEYRSDSAASSAIISAREEAPTPSSVRSSKSRNEFLNSPFWQANARVNVDSPSDRSDSLSRMSSITASTARSLPKSLTTSNQIDSKDTDLQSSFMPPLFSKSQDVKIHDVNSVRSLNPFKPLPPTKISSPVASTTEEESNVDMDSSSPESDN